MPDIINNTLVRDNPGFRFNSELKRIYSENGAIRNITERGQDFGKRLRSFEDSMRSGQTVALFNYGSNIPEDIAKLFAEKGVNLRLVFAGQAQMKGARISYGSRSISRGCPVATIQEAGWQESLFGHMILVDKDQFGVIAGKECGGSKGREFGKGRYRRAVVYLDDPREPGVEMQAVTFVLNEKHPDLSTYPIGTEPIIKRQLGNTQEGRKFVKYLNLIQKQKEQSSEMQNRQLFGGPSIEIKWHSGKFLQERESRR